MARNLMGHPMRREHLSSPYFQRTRSYFLAALLFAAFVIAFLPTFKELITAWSISDDSSHGFLIVPIAFYIIWIKRRELSASASAGSLTGLAVAVASILTYLFARAGEIMTLSSVSLIVFLAGGVIYLLGYGVLRTLLFPFFLLLFMIPVPAQVYAALTIPLQLLVTKTATAIATLAGIPLFREGNIIFHSQGTFEVVQACSGLRSIMALLTVGVLIGYFSLKSNLLRGILLVTAIPIAVAVNVIRVITMIMVLHFTGFNLSEGTAHSLLGIILFCFALGLFALTRKGLAKWDR
jgi:exosortase